MISRLFRLFGWGDADCGEARMEREGEGVAT